MCQLERNRRVMTRLYVDVTEGYQTGTHPSYTLPQKSISSGAIFRSANDTLRDVYSAQPLTNGSLISRRKRPLSQSESTLDHLGDTEDEESKMLLDTQRPEGEEEPANYRDQMCKRTDLRQVKPLRRPRRGLTGTQSLPGDIFAFTHPQSKGDAVLAQQETEDDWSMDASSEQPSFSPMTL